LRPKITLSLPLTVRPFYLVVLKVYHFFAFFQAPAYLILPKQVTPNHDSTNPSAFFSLKQKTGSDLFIAFSRKIDLTPFFLNLRLAKLALFIWLFTATTLTLSDLFDYPTDNKAGNTKKYG
jgi:hypothetical protein